MKKKELQKICIFGNFDPNYLRNKVILKGLSQFKSQQIYLINFQTKPFNRTPFLIFLGDLLKKSIKMLISLFCNSFTAIIIPYQGIPSIFYASLYKQFKKKENEDVKIIFDPFISLYESYTRDYHAFDENSFFGNLLYVFERKAFLIADLILADTNQHKKLYRELYNPKCKIKTLYLGTDPKYILEFKETQKRQKALNQKALKTQNQKEKKEKRSKENFIVSFIGTYIPLQGISYILESAKFLQDDYPEIIFEIIGGNLKQQMPYRKFVKKKKITNVKFVDPVKWKDLPKFLYRSDIQLGIFGSSGKAQRVIPNKIYVGIAAGKPVITQESSAIKEIFKHKENIYLCPRADGKALALSIIDLYKNKKLREKIGRKSEELFYSKLIPNQIGQNLIKFFSEI